MQFFKRYDDIGIPNDDDLDRFWDQELSVFGRCVEGSDSIEAGDKVLMLPAKGIGSDGDGREIVPIPVQNATGEAETEIVVSTEDGHDDTGHDAEVDDDNPHSTVTDQLTTVIGDDAEDGCVTPYR